MLRSDWNILAPFAGLAAILIALGLGSYVTATLDNPEQRYPSYRQSGEQAEEGAEPTTANIANSVQYRTPCRQPQSEGEADLCAQWRAAYAAEESAFWTRLGFWAGLFGLAGLYWQVMLTRRAVEGTGDATVAMRDANRIAKESNRPWIKITPPLYATINRVDDSPPGVQIPIGVKNFGQSPAVGLSMMVAIHPSGDLTEADVIRRVADIAAFAADGISLYPKEESTLGEDSTFFATIIRSPHFVGELFEPSKLIYLTVSIFYKSVATEQVYHTSIFFLISANIPEIPTAIELQQVGREYHGAVVDHHYTYDEEYHRQRGQ